MLKTRDLTESLNRKYDLEESWEEEFDDEADYIMSSDLSDEEKSEEMDKLLNKYNHMNEDLSDDDIFNNLAGKIFNAAERFFIRSSKKVTYDEWIQACEKAFFALEDEGYTEKDSINESKLNEEFYDIQDLYDKVKEYFYDELTNFEVQHPVQEIMRIFPDYNWEWCAEDAYSDSAQEAEKFKVKYSKALADACFENAYKDIE